MYKMVNAFNQTAADKAKMAEAEKQFKHKCWLPESIMGLGDTYVFFNSLDDLVPNAVGKTWLRDAVEKNPQWIQ